MRYELREASRFDAYVFDIETGTTYGAINLIQAENLLDKLNDYETEISKLSEFRALAMAAKGTG